MSVGYDNAPITQFISIVTAVFTLFLNRYGYHDNNSEAYGINIHEIFINNEYWRLLTSQIIYSHTGQVIVSLIILYTCRQFERQMGTKKFGGFVILSLLFSLCISIALSVIASTIGTVFNPSSGPFCFIFSLIVLFYLHIPKIPTGSSQYVILGMEFSEKSWIYLLALQLCFSEGINSAIPSVIGAIAGILYDRDRYGVQLFRLPHRLELFCSFVGSFFTFPANNNNNNNNRNQPLMNAQMDRQPLFNQDGGGLINDRNNNFGGGMRHRQQQQQQPPDEESILTLMGMGFDRESVVRALQTTGNNVEAAANILLR